MRPEGNPLDLNNLPEEYGKQVLEESSTTTAASTENSRFKKKKKEGKDESGKIYECRFCSLKFCKSQALGGHMNRHRQERETETLNRARQLVFSSDSITGAGAHMGLRDLNFGSSMQTMPSSCFQQVGNIGDPRLHFRPVYPRIPAPAPQPQHLQSYMYTSPSSHPFQSPYPPPQAPAAAAPPPPPMNDYYIGRVLASSSHNQPHNSNFPFFGTSSPAGSEPTRPQMASIAMDGGNWNYGHRLVQHNTDPSSVDRFRDDI